MPMILVAIKLMLGIWINLVYQVLIQVIIWEVDQEVEQFLVAEAQVLVWDKMKKQLPVQ